MQTSVLNIGIFNRSHWIDLTSLQQSVLELLCFVDVLWNVEVVLLVTKGQSPNDRVPGDIFASIVAENHRLEQKLELQNETIKFLRRRVASMETKLRPKKIAIAGEGTPLSVMSPEQLEASKQKLGGNVW